MYEEHRGRLGEPEEANTLDTFSASHEPDVFRASDNRFLELASKPRQLAYIREHPDEFCRDTAS